MNIWEQVFASLQWLQGQTATASPASLVTQTDLVLETALNGAQILSTQSLLNATNTEIPLLRQVAALPVSYTNDQSFAINSRLSSLVSLGAALGAIANPNSPGTAATLLSANSVAIPDIGLLSILSSWTSESAPSYFAGNVVSGSAQYNTIWQSIVTTVEGSTNGLPLDCASRIASGTASIAAIMGGLQPTTVSSSSWDQNVALPATLVSLRLLRPDISLASSQASMITRAFCLYMAIQLAQFAIIAKGLVGTANGAQAISATSQQNQGLMDIASANLGNFEDWSNLTTGIPAPWGAGALAPGTQVPLVSGTSAATQAQILGTDINIGPQNGSMPPWTGDYQTLSGIINYSAAIGRRLATPLGALIYHPNFGSRIPPEIGQVLTVGAQSLITAYGKSAIASDPRTQQIISAQTSLLSGQAVLFSANVQPIGPGLNPVQINEVLSP